MQDRESRRKSKRHQVSWKAAVVFDESSQRPPLYTLTNNLSIGGAAIVSDYADLTGWNVTLVLGLKSRDVTAPRMLMLSASVVSTTRAPTQSKYQHGLRFENLDLETQELLRKLLDANAPDGGDSAVATAGAPGIGRLAALKQQVQAKQAEAEKPDEGKKDGDRQLSLAIEKIYRYLKEFTEQLNSLQLEYPKTYLLAGLPKFEGLAWKAGQVTSQTRQIAPGTMQFERATLVFQLSADKKICVTREPPADDSLKNLLRETKIQYTTREERNDRGKVVKTLFEIPCEVMARLELVGNFDSGKLLLRTDNIERFGMMDYELDPAAVSDDSLDEFGGFILGERTHIGPMFLKKR